MEFAAEVHQAYEPNRMRRLLELYSLLFPSEFADLLNTNHDSYYSLRNALSTMHELLNNIRRPTACLNLSEVESGSFRFLEAQSKRNWKQMKESHKSGIIKQFGLQITEIKRCKSCRVGRATTRHDIGARFVPTDNGDTLDSLYNKFTAIKNVNDAVTH
ncbi:hypothetical protein MTO96_034106 [Rhipicephalus appendiculatus]